MDAIRRGRGSRLHFVPMASWRVQTPDGQKLYTNCGAGPRTRAPLRLPYQTRGSASAGSAGQHSSLQSPRTPPNPRPTSSEASSTSSSPNSSLHRARGVARRGGRPGLITRDFGHSAPHHRPLRAAPWKVHRRRGHGVGEPPTAREDDAERAVRRRRSHFSSSRRRPRRRTPRTRGRVITGEGGGQPRAVGPRARRRRSRQHRVARAGRRPSRETVLVGRVDAARERGSRSCTSTRLVRA